MHLVPAHRNQIDAFMQERLHFLAETLRRVHVKIGGVIGKRIGDVREAHAGKRDNVAGAG